MLGALFCDVNRGAGLITYTVCRPVSTFHSLSRATAGGDGVVVKALRDTVWKYIAAVNAAISDPFDFGGDREIQNPFFMINRANLKTPAPLMWLIYTQITLHLVGARRGSAEIRSGSGSG